MAKKRTQDFAPKINSLAKMKVRNYLNNDVKEYAMYVLKTRALPSVMDGMRIGARKILSTALNGTAKNGGVLKMVDFIGQTSALHYNHGDASLKNTIVQLGSKHVMKYCPFHIVGQIGSLRVPKTDTAARYLKMKLNDNMDIFRQDVDILEYMRDEGDLIEPKHLLPVVPYMLLYRTNSPGFGFSFRSNSYTLDSVIDNCLLALITGTCVNSLDHIRLIPEIEGIDPANMIYNASKNVWYNVGEYTLDFEKDELHITDLPFSVTIEAIDKQFKALKEQEYIKDFINNSRDGDISVIVEFPKGRLRTIYMSNKFGFYKKMKLFVNLYRDIYNCIDLNDNIVFFDDAYNYIDYFVDLRLKFYTIAKNHKIKKIEDRIAKLSNERKFIQLVIDEVIIVNKRKDSEIKIDLDKHELSYECLSIRISRFTEEEIQKLDNNIASLKQELADVIALTEKEMFINDLVELRNKYIPMKSMINVK